MVTPAAAATTTATATAATATTTTTTTTTPTTHEKNTVKDQPTNRPTHWFLGGRCLAAILSRYVAHSGRTLQSRSSRGNGDI